MGNMNNMFGNDRRMRDLVPENVIGGPVCKERMSLNEYLMWNSTMADSMIFMGQVEDSLNVVKFLNKQRDMIVSEYLNGEDSIGKRDLIIIIVRRETLAKADVEKTNRKLKLPEELRTKVKPGKDPIEAMKKLNLELVRRFINFICDVPLVAEI
jgi:hypothetical protein